LAVFLGQEYKIALQSFIIVRSVDIIILQHTFEAEFTLKCQKYFSVKSNLLFHLNKNIYERPNNVKNILVLN